MDTKYLPKEICGIISNYCSTFLTICENIINILPMIDKNILYNVEHITPNTLKELLKYPKFDPNLIDISPIIDKRNDHDYTNYHILSFFIDENNIEIVKLLLDDKKVNPCFGENNDDAISLAVFNNNVEIVKLLLDDKRINPCMNENYILRQSCRFGYTEIVKLIFEDGRVDLSLYTDSTIKRASLCGYKEIVKLYIDNVELDENIYDYIVMTSLKNKQYEIIVDLILKNKIELILENKIEPTFSNSHITRIISNPDIDAIKFLLDKQKINNNSV